jgi:hypothetical protein
MVPDAPSQTGRDLRYTHTQTHTNTHTQTHTHNSRVDTEAMIEHFFRTVGETSVGAREDPQVRKRETGGCRGRVWGGKGRDTGRDKSL